MGFFEKLTFTRRQVLAGTAGIGAAVSAGCAAGNGQQSTLAQPPKLAIVHTNDSHGHDLLNSESLGLAAASQLKLDYQEQGYDVLLLDAGDAVQGDILVNYSSGATAIEFFNACQYDAMALGNHEFDFGQEDIFNYVTAAEFPILSANVIVRETGDPMVSPRVVLTTDSGLKVGVFGLTTPETYTKVNPLIVKGLTFLEGDELYACA